MSESYVWRPTDDIVERANVTRLAHRHGLTSYRELLARSREEIEWFWPAVVEDLGIEFDKRYSRVLDTTRGVQFPLWFAGGEINIATDCVDRHRGPSRAVVWEGEEGATRELSYEELADEVSRLASALRSLGVRRGDAVGLFLPMIPEAVVTLMACCKIGAIVVPIFSGYAASAVSVRLEDSEAKVLICADGFYRRGSVVNMKETADEAVASSAFVEHVIVVRRVGREVPMTERDHLWDELLRDRASDARTEATTSEDPFMIAYTSGTTGRPKGSVHVHGGFLVKIASEVAYQTDYQLGELLFWLSDPGWIMGPWEIVGTLALGGTIFLYDGAPNHPGPDRLWDMVERHRVNILGVSPTLIRSLQPAGDEHIERHDLSSLRILGSTGEPWNTEPYMWFFERVGGKRCPVMNFSGGTEVGACFLSPVPTIPLKACSLGGPALGMAIDVFGADGRPVPPGQVGELVCTKPWPGMTRGIWGDPDRYIETYWSRWPDVWVHGDWASVDADGEWFLHGRSDDTISVAGKRVGPAEVESMLVEHPDVVEAVAIGVPDEVKGEVIWCYCVLADGSVASDELRSAIGAHVASRLGAPFRPGAVKFVSEIPKTRNAKVLRRAVRAMALGQDAGDLSSLENPSALDEVRTAR